MLTRDLAQEMMKMKQSIIELAAKVTEIEKAVGQLVDLLHDDETGAANKAWNITE